MSRSFVLPALLVPSRSPHRSRSGAAGSAGIDGPWRREPDRRPPEVSVCGIDPRGLAAPVTPTLHLVAADGIPRPRSVAELLGPPAASVRPAGPPAGPAADPAADPGADPLVAEPSGVVPADGLRVRRLGVDVRLLARVLERRGGANLLAQIVRDPTDRVANAVFRAAMRTPSRGDGPEGRDGADTECVVRVDDPGGSRGRIDLGQARMTLLALLTEGERATRRLAEALARPRDRGLRRGLEEMLAARVAELPVRVLLRPAAPAPGPGGSGPAGSGGVDDQDVGLRPA